MMRQNFNQKIRKENSVIEVTVENDEKKTERTSNTETLERRRRSERSEKKD